MANKYGAVRIRPALQTYAWGAPAGCIVHQLTNTDAEFNAEAWFGDHRNGPATACLPGGEELALPALLLRHPELFGGKALMVGGVQRLPFLPKVLSIKEKTPLSFQIHPCAEDAARLHAANPGDYPDPLPKDEAAVALAPVELFYGFQPLKAIETAVAALPALRPAFGPRTGKTPADINRGMCERLFSLEAGELEEICQRVAESLKQQEDSLTQGEEWAQVLLAAYPRGDVGALLPFLLNFVKLKPGEGISIPCGRMHVYLSGELAEVMRPSDNVIRCGATPKKKDPVEILRCGEFDPVDVRTAVLQGTRKLGVTTYDFGTDAFAIRTVDKANDHAGNLPNALPVGSPGILLSLDAHGVFSTNLDRHELTPGAAFLVSGSCESASVQVHSGSCIYYSVPA